jgi:D-alanyl-D-alanine carboxypeptidase
MLRRYLAALVAVAVGVLATGAVAAPDAPSQSRDSKLRATLAALTKRASSPGGVLHVQTPARTWSGAVGLARIKPKRSMRVSDRFRVASVTKTFTAALVLQLANDGALSLDDSVERWLPGRLEDGAGARVTVRHLLSHTSGLNDDVPEWVAGPPGPFYYANSNYLLLGEIVRAATGSSFGDELSRRILVPLRLRDTAVSSQTAPPGIVHGYSPSLPRVDLTALPMTGPDGGLISTARDLVAFQRALFAGRVIPLPLVEAMQAPGSVQGFASAGYDAYGLGLMRFPSRCGAAWGHRGRHEGYTSLVLSTADGRRTVAALLNAGQIGNAATVTAISRMVALTLCF